LNGSPRLCSQTKVNLIMGLKAFTGIVFIILGGLLIMYAAYNINELLFIQGRVGMSDLPRYNIAVFVPILLGILAAIDGSAICALARRSSLLFHSVANVVWLFSSYRLFLALQESLTSRLVFYRIFAFFILAIVLFTLGAIVNFLPRSKKTNRSE